MISPFYPDRSAGLRVVISPDPRRYGDLPADVQVPEAFRREFNEWSRRFFPPCGMARAFGIAGALAAEVMYENDEGVASYTWVSVEIAGPMRPWRHERHTREVSIPAMHVAEKRWHHMRAWAVSHLAG